MGLRSEVKYPLIRFVDKLRERHDTPPHINTLRNWAKRGVRNHRSKLCFLETMFIGAMQFTSIEAYDRFCDELNVEEED